MATFIVNSSLSGTDFYARVYNIADETDATLSEAEYPENGTVDLSAGKGADTQYVPKVGDAVYWIQQADGSSIYQVFGLDIKAGNVADVYWGDQDTPVSLTQADKEYILPTESWKMLEEIPDIAKPAFTPYKVHISCNRTTPPTDILDVEIAYPVGVFGNDWLRADTDAVTEYNLVDSDNNPTDLMIRFGSDFETHTRTDPSTTEVDALSRHQMCNAWTSETDEYIDLFLVAGTYTLDVSGAGSGGGTTEYTFNNDVSEVLVITVPQPNKVTFADYIISADGWYRLDIVPTSITSVLSGIDIERIA